MSTVPAGIVALCLLLAYTGCTDQRPQNHQHETPAQASEADSGNPFAVMTPSEREALRQQLANEGKYDCCTKPGCTECILNPGECNCQANLRRKDPICGECLNGYREGRGKLKLVSIVELEKIRHEKRSARTE